MANDISSERTRSRPPAVMVARFISILLFAATWVPATLPAPAVQAAPAPSGPKAYVALHNEGALAVLDTGRNRVLYYMPVRLNPHGLAITPSGRKLYVGSDELSTVSVVDTTTDRIVGDINVGLSPDWLSLSPDGRQLVASVWGADQVVLVDTTTDRIIGRVSVTKPDRSAISPDGRIAYVGSSSLDHPALTIVDLSKPAVIGRVPVPHTPSALAISPDGKRLYFTIEGTDAVQVLDTGRNRIVATVPAGASPHGLVWASAAYGILALSRQRGELEILDPVRNVVRGVVAVGRHPYGIAASADDRTVYVTNEGSGDLSVVDLVNRTVTATISIDSIGGTPRDIVVQAPPIESAPASRRSGGTSVSQFSPADSGSATSPSSLPPGYNGGYDTVVAPPQPLWTVQFPL